jgi:hypothetical protein
MSIDNLDETLPVNGCVHLTCLAASNDSYATTTSLHSRCGLL